MPTLNWIGKQAVEKHRLEYDEPLSVGDKESSKVLMPVDNIHTLKVILPYYVGKVKCIYMYLPYDIGNKGGQYNRPSTTRHKNGHRVFNQIPFGMKTS